jgi:hypothetical protein
LALQSGQLLLMAVENAVENAPPRHSAISAQIFELLKVVVTLVLTGLIGGGITYYYQNRAHREQQDAQELEAARQSALTFLREVGDILEQRRHHALRVVDSIRDNGSPEESSKAWKDYTDSVSAWNAKWNLYRALVLEQFGPEMQKRFYDQTEDQTKDLPWDKRSITGKLISLDNMLNDYYKPDPQRTRPDPNQIKSRYTSLTEDCYRFYSEVIVRIQEGRVGKNSWVESAARPSPNG